MQEKLPNIPEKTPVRVVVTFIVGILSFTVFGVGIWLLVQSYSNVSTSDDLRARVRLQYKHEVDTESRKLLETYGWMDQEQGIAHVPIEEAAKTVVAKYQSVQTSASSVPVPGSKAAEAAAQALLEQSSGGADDQQEADNANPSAEENAAADESQTDANEADTGDEADQPAATAPEQEPAAVTEDVNPESLIPLEEENYTSGQGTS